MEYGVDTIISLISRLHTLTADFTKRRLAEHSFVSSHGFILYLLSENEHMTMGEISDQINRDKSTATYLIRQLEKEGLVETRLSDADSRIKYVALTEEGKKYNALTSEISRSLLEACFKGFTEADRETLLGMLNRMRRNLEDAAENPAGGAICAGGGKN